MLLIFGYDSKLTGSEVGERERDAIEKGPQAGTRTRDAQSTLCSWLLLKPTKPPPVNSILLNSSL